MPKAIHFHKPDGRDVLVWEEVAVKAKVAKARGCDYPIIYTREDFVGRVAEITKGEKLPVLPQRRMPATTNRPVSCARIISVQCTTH